MTERRRGLGRGLAALIPAAPRSTEDVSTTAGPTSPSAVPVLPAERGVAASVIAESAASEAASSELSSESVPEADATGAVEDASSWQDVATGSTVAGAMFAELPLDSITTNPRQPREVFDEDALAELVTSVKEVGLLQPVVVRSLGGERFELIMGERRWRACREAGLEAIPAIIRATEDDRLLLDALLENLHRAQLNPLEEAAAYDQLLREFNCTHEELADRIGRSRPQVTNTLRLLGLSPTVQRRVAAGVLSAGHARALLSVKDAETQDRLAHRIVAEGLSVRAIEEIVSLEEGTRPKSRGPRAGKRVSPALENLAGRLSDRFETRVKVDLGQKKGKLVVEFASMEDLERILGQLAPGEGRVLGDQLKEPGGESTS
ncbi:ParB/RepB/Spo0J family partition protein [Streptomyces bohaiensis]|uniref:ParB/RepB/Spo0J family partition protein n=1 Tax=Streptomyces bohaiensis TaxID=1431344 RepID=A0ABX1CBW8_9ACTN|nr:ParB/RepB/Spo0J family partition protein [Streptomyces bohaiensis]NJQ14634.1 ParB/RepB/Spo0J family partition protein [Streptomyces bohaiensis]